MLTAHIDPWGRSLQYLMSAVGVSGLCILALFRYIQVTATRDARRPLPSAAACACA